jgi:hypothetical protein
MFPKNFIPWRDSNPGVLVPKADAMSTAPLGCNTSAFIRVPSSFQGVHVLHFSDKNIARHPSLREKLYWMLTSKNTKKDFFSKMEMFLFTFFATMIWYCSSSRFKMNTKSEKL